ncbi:GHKL domain-containing protein [Sphingobacterium psychroaquaticum]|uniref:GHKL domain-containing protein n=2 Tax=Sphingobacterium psychroaquaticum TaxID=561061 RepID=A0A1X7KUT9_9SPHI|nr:GHKL domain-containing protein [Sphingobacterium psychroaquaticum]SMG45084.1 GHKL domain-containing protein [Sphingobacterium psychroaquaticum]
MIFKMTSKNRLVHASSWTICILYFLVSYFLLWWDHRPKAVSPYEPIIGALSITICCYLIYSTLQYYLPRKNQYIKITVICLVLTTVSVGLSLFFLNQFFDNLSLSHFFEVLPYRFIINFLLLLCVTIINIFWNIQEEYEENKKRKEESERILRDAELYNLRQQLQPHFLFNSLNSIIALIGIKPDQARNMTFQLSDFLRGTMRKDDKQLIPLSDEITHLTLYLDIEKVRFGHRLTTTFSLQEEAAKAKVPSMIIQPLLENAIKFGLYNVIGDVEITIDIRLENYMLYITITNPFDSDQFETKKGTGFGLSSIQRRLFLLYGRTDLLDTSIKNNIFTSTLKIPQYD